MNPNIERLKLIFLGVFVALAVAVIVWQVGWIAPGKRCGEAHKWWDPGERVCAQPVLISDITGRVITDEKALAEAKKAVGRPLSSSGEGDSARPSGVGSPTRPAPKAQSTLP
jgi:hypothetical protein